MNESRLRSIDRIARKLCELYQQQVDTLQQGTLAGLADGELKQYSRRRRQTRELHMALNNLQPSIFIGIGCQSVKPDQRVIRRLMVDGHRPAQ
jgi:hypothetical protein